PAATAPQQPATAATPAQSADNKVSAPTSSQPTISGPPLQSGGRLALVIGNGAYKSAAALPNPANDAHAIAKTLRDLGFSVIEATDLDRVAMEKAMLQFLQSASSASIRVLFYAGHGLQIDGSNYLVPTDAVVSNRRAAGFELIDTD